MIILLDIDLSDPQTEMCVVHSLYALSYPVLLYYIQNTHIKLHFRVIERAS